MSFWRQLRALLWKNYLLKRRKWYFTIAELFLPLVLCLILVVLRTLKKAPTDPHGQTKQFAVPLPSAGLSAMAMNLCPEATDKNDNGIPFYANNRMNEFLKLMDNLASNHSDLSLQELDSLGKQVDEALDMEEGNYDLFHDYLLKAKRFIELWRPIHNFSEDSFKSILTANVHSCSSRNGTNSTNSGSAIPTDYGGLVFEMMKVVVCGDDKGMKRFLTVAEGTGSATQKQPKQAEPESASEKSKDSMQVLKYLGNRNSKVLYAPTNVTSMRKVMDKVNATFVMLDRARQWAQNYSMALVELDEGFFENIAVRIGKVQNRIGEKRRRPVVGDFSFRQDSFRQALCMFANWLHGVNLDIFQGFSNGNELEEFRLNAWQHNTTVLAGVVFDLKETDQEELPKHTTFSIRVNVSMTESTRAYRNIFNYPGPRYNDKYYTRGFLFLQDLFERAIIDVHANRSIREPGTFMQFIPFPCYYSDSFLRDVEKIFSLLVVISYLFSFALLVESIVAEKERHLKDVMHSMGMDTTVLWLSWFITQFVISTISFAMITLLLRFGNMLIYSDPFLIFILLELFGISAIFLSFLVSTFFSNTKIATASAGILFFLTFLPFLYGTIRVQSTGQPLAGWIKILSSLSSTTALGYIFHYVLYEEMKSTGSHFSNIFISPLNSNDSFCIFYGIVMLVVDSFIYVLLTIYIEAIMPSNGGLTKPWYFPVEAVWNKFSARLEMLEGEDEESSQKPASSENFEQVPESLKDSEAGIKVKKLFKRFKKGVRTYAVYDVSLTMYRDEIVVFLGHNGAGKTTTIQMITGLTKITSGSVEVNGVNVTKNASISELSLGICPQHNVLFDQLTVLEHLRFYSFLKFKNTYTEETDQEIDQMISDLELEDKRNAAASTLSGGMKRRLSIAIAFVAGSKAVILDEPTSGVDPHARRAIWDLILKYKKGRTIMISTHFMDEAELLADRIAIMSDGQLKAVGSPLFLLKQFGEGYTIRLGLQHNSTETGSNEKGSSCVDSDAEAIRAAIEEFMIQFGPDPMVLKVSRYEAIYRLKDWTPEQMIAMFEVLKSTEERDKMKITSYGIRDGSLEEVFMKVGTSHHVEEDSDTIEEGNSGEEPDSKFDFPFIRMGNPALLPGRRFLAQLYKRFWGFCRNWKTAIVQLALPAIFVAVGMSIAFPSLFLLDYPAITQSTFQISNLSESSRQRSAVFYENLGLGVQEEAYKNDDGYLDSDLLVTSFYNPSGMNAECLINSFGTTWLDANYPQNSKYLDKQVQPDMFHPTCKYRIAYNSSFQPRLKHFYLPRYMGNKSDPESYYPNCTCSVKGSECKWTTRKHRDYIPLETGDDLYDITGLDATKYLLNTRQFFPLRYGGFSVGLNVSDVPQGYGVHNNEFLRLLAVRHVSKVWYDSIAYHAQSIFLNALNNDILRSAVRESLNVTGNPGLYGITVINYPFQGTEEEISMQKLLENNDILITLFIVIALAFVPSAFIYVLVHEKATLSRHLEYLSGMPGPLYWFSNLFWHLLNYCLPALLCIGIIRACNIPLYVAPVNFLGIVLLILLYGWACTPLTYLLSFLFDNASTAFLVTLVGNLSISISTVFISYLLQLINVDGKLGNSVDYVQYAFLAFPGFALGQGIMEIVLTNYKNQANELQGKNQIIPVFKFVFINANLVVLAAEGAIAFILTLLIEVFRHRIRRQMIKEPSLPRYEEKETIDPDVMAEKKRVLEGNSDNEDVLVVRGISKVYSSKTLLPCQKGSNRNIVAVDHLCIALEKGECFGLLGVNGAGKSTSFNMLSSLTCPTSGDVLLGGQRVHDNQGALSIGYCPQFDTVYNELTVKQHLIFYSLIFGYHSDDIEMLVRWLMNKLNLIQYRNATASSLSGGTKRKLATAIAVVSDPQLLLLDEPSTGMDPKSRRFLWETIRSLSAAGKSIIFTSHSMEECEELCHRIAIMVNGRLKCLGSSQHLKSKYGNGYTVRLRLEKGAFSIERQQVKNSVLERFSDAVLLDGNFVYMQFELDSSDIDLSALFRFCEDLVHPSDKTVPALVSSYSIRQNDLCNLFVSFVREQTDSQEHCLRPYGDDDLCPVASTEMNE